MDLSVSSVVIVGAYRFPLLIPDSVLKVLLQRIEPKMRITNTRAEGRQAQMIEMLHSIKDQ